MKKNKGIKNSQDNLFGKDMYQIICSYLFLKYTKILNVWTHIKSKVYNNEQ